jgi:hypothetical protein
MGKIKEMRLRVLLADGEKTTDLIWFKVRGQDIYGGYVGASSKYSYHASGQLHQTDSKTGEVKNLRKHLPVANFRGRFEICQFSFGSKMPKSGRLGREFGKEKTDAILYLDSRTLPEHVSLAVGLLEPGKMEELNPLISHEVMNISHVFLVTKTTPWIYLLVKSLRPEWELKVKEIFKKLKEERLPPSAAA